MEHLRLLVGRDSAADTSLRHFGSLKELHRASFLELRQFLTRREAKALIAGLSSVVDTEEALSGPLDKAEAVYRANLEMRCFRQEVVRVAQPLPFGIPVSGIGGNRLPRIACLQAVTAIASVPASSFGLRGYDSLTHAKSVLISPPDVAIDHLFPPYTKEKVQALDQWFDY